MARRLGILLATMLLLASPVIADEAADEQGKRLDEIVRLSQEGVADAVIVKHIRASGFIFYLSADDILELRALQVSDLVIEALIDTGVSEQPPRRTSRIEYEPDTSLYVGISAGYFSPWYWYPYAWGFYYDPFPSYYSHYYYPFACSPYWGYYGYCNNYYYNDYWAPHRYDHWPYYDELARRRGGAVNVPVEGRGSTQFAVARANRPAAGVTTPAAAPRRLARSGATVRRDVTPRLDASRRTRSRIHTREGTVGQAVNAPRSTRRWSTPPPQAREVSRPAERRSASPTRHLQPSSGGMHVRQGSSAASPGRGPSHSASPPASRSVSIPAGRSMAPARSSPSSGSRLRFR